MNLLQIRTAIRNQTETDEDDITDADIDGWVNHAYDIVIGHDDWPFLEKEATIAVNAGDFTFTLPADFDAFREVRYAPTGASDNTIRQINPEESPNFLTGAQGRSRVFWRVGNSALRMWPELDSAGNVTLRYYASPVPLTVDGDTPTFSSRYHRILVVGGLASVYERLDMWEEAQFKWQQFYQLLAAMEYYYNRLRQGMVYGEHAHGYRGESNPGRPPFAWES